jgi:MFS family permease
MKMISWISRDGKILIAARMIRSSTSGFFGVALAIYFSQLGYSDFLIGIALTASLVSSAGFTIIASLLERRYGRKRVLILLALLSTLSTTIFVVSANYEGLLLATGIGTISYTGKSGGGGPFLAIEQAIIPQTTSPEKRTAAYGVFNSVGRLATSVGALIAAIPTLLEHVGFGLVDSFRIVFIIASLSTLSTLFFFLSLSHETEIKTARIAPPNPRPILSVESKRRIARLAALLGFDAFGGGFVIQSIVSLWFYTRFGISLQEISFILFLAGLLSASSYLVSAQIATRLGLVNTMVFTQLPSNVITMLIPFAPTFSLAAAIYLIRGFLNPMDVVPRQSYIAVIVKPEERVAAAGIANVSSNISQAVSPSISGYLIQFATLVSAPFLVAGSLKIVYDFILYFSFRALRAPEEILRNATS